MHDLCSVLFSKCVNGMICNWERMRRFQEPKQPGQFARFLSQICTFPFTLEKYAVAVFKSQIRLAGNGDGMGW